MDAFKAAARCAFEDEMVVHLAEFSPPLFQTIGEKQMREAIRLGISRADGYGFTFRGSVRLYLELMLLFGSHFDTDPQYPWVAEILAARDSSSQRQRADQLYKKTLDYRMKVVGPKDAYALEALENISIMAQNPLPFSSGGLGSGLLREIKRIYPEKAAYVGDQGIEILIRKGMSGARRQQFTTERGLTLVVVLMLAFGHGCGSDPLYPWIARTLEDERITDPEARAKRLETKALTWLEHVLANVDQEIQK